MYFSDETLGKPKPNNALFFGGIQVGHISLEDYVGVGSSLIAFGV